MEPDQRPRRRRRITVNRCRCGKCKTCRAFDRVAAQALKEKVRAGLRPMPPAPPAVDRGPDDSAEFKKWRDSIAPYLQWPL